MTKNIKFIKYEQWGLHFYRYLNVTQKFILITLVTYLFLLSAPLMPISRPFPSQTASTKTFKRANVVEQVLRRPFPMDVFGLYPFPGFWLIVYCQQNLFMLYWLRCELVTVVVTVFFFTSWNKFT